MVAESLLLICCLLWLAAIRVETVCPMGSYGNIEEGLCYYLLTARDMPLVQAALGKLDVGHEEKIDNYDDASNTCNNLHLLLPAGKDKNAKFVNESGYSDPMQLHIWARLEQLPTKVRVASVRSLEHAEQLMILALKTGTPTEDERVKRQETVTHRTFFVNISKAVAARLESLKPESPSRQIRPGDCGLLADWAPGYEAEEDWKARGFYWVNCTRAIKPDAAPMYQIKTIICEFDEPHDCEYKIGTICTAIDNVCVSQARIKITQEPKFGGAPCPFYSQHHKYTLCMDERLSIGCQEVCEWSAWQIPNVCPAGQYIYVNRTKIRYEKFQGQCFGAHRKRYYCRSPNTFPSSRGWLAVLAIIVAIFGCPTVV